MVEHCTNTCDGNSNHKKYGNAVKVCNILHKTEIENSEDLIFDYRFMRRIAKCLPLYLWLQLCSLIIFTISFVIGSFVEFDLLCAIISSICLNICSMSNAQALKNQQILMNNAMSAANINVIIIAASSWHSKAYANANLFVTSNGNLKKAIWLLFSLDNQPKWMNWKLIYVAEYGKNHASPPPFI